LAIHDSDPGHRIYQPSQSLIKTCKGILQRLKLRALRLDIGKDTISLALFLLLKMRLRFNFTLLEASAPIWLVIAVKTAFATTHDGTIYLKSWCWNTSVPPRLSRRMEPMFFRRLDWDLWVREDEFEDFVGRMEFVWLFVEGANTDDSQSDAS
jgi:hypothetical protein